MTLTRLPIPKNIKKELGTAEPGQVVHNTPVGSVVAVPDRMIRCSKCAFSDYDCSYGATTICIYSLLRPREICPLIFVTVDKIVEEL